MRFISNLQSQIQQEMEFLRSVFEERSAKMEDLSEGDWGDISYFIRLADRWVIRMTCSYGS
jgi:hypothetical protein